MPNQTMRVNGFDYDHSSCLIRLGVFQVDRIKDINYGHEITGSTKSRGTSRQATGATAGNYESNDMTITFYRDGWESYRDRLGPGYMDRRENVSIQASGDGMPTLNDVITGCRIMKVEKGSAEGGNPHEVKVTYQTISVLENGIAPIKKFAK